MKYMVCFKGEMPRRSSSGQYNLRWQSWMEELKKMGVYESGVIYGAAGKKIKKSGIPGRGRPENKLAGYLVVNVSTVEEAREILGQVPHFSLGDGARGSGPDNVRILGFQVC